jgi:hypothetical protein
MNYHPAVTFVAPYRVYVPDEFFCASVGGFSVRIKAAPLPPIASDAALQVHGQNVEIAHDIFGFAGRTQFHVVLGEVVNTSDPSWKQHMCSRDQEFVEYALQAVNRLLAVYRDQDVNRIGVPSFHVIELVRGDISNISLVVVDDDLNQVDDFAITLPGYRTMGFGEAVARESSVINAIRTYLINATEIPVERELLTSARNHLYRRQLRLVPVEANTAFESYAFSALQRASPTTTLPDSSDVFTRLRELESVFSSASISKTIPFARWFDPTIQGWKGLLSTELKQWHSDCYELRNKVIHRGYNAVTPVEADAAIKHTQAAIAMIEQCIATLTP